MWLDFDVRDNRRCTFSLDEALLWIIDSDFSENVLMMDLFQLLWSSPDVNWWTGVVWITCGLLWCFYQLFELSFWRHPFTAEHPLMRHWWNNTSLLYYLSLILGEDWLGKFTSALIQSFIFQHVAFVFCWSVFLFEPHVFCLCAESKFNHTMTSQKIPPFQARTARLGSSLPRTIKNHKPLKPL